MSYISRLGRALIGLSEAKASSVGSMIARLMLGQPVWPNRDYEKLGREGYQQNPVVARAVDLIASGVASITLELHQGRGKRVKVLEDHPLLKLLRQPNPEQDGHTLVQSAVSHLVIAGNAYLERTAEDDFERMELFALRPDRMRVVPGAQGYAEAYEYSVGGQRRRMAIDIDRGLRPVLHLKRFHPVDDWYGMSALDPAAWSIDTHNAAAAFNKALLDNSGSPSGAFVFSGNPDNGNRLEDSQYDRLKQMIDEQVKGSANAGRPLILEGGLDWKQMGLDLENLQFVETKNMAAREIAFVLGVPPMLLGIPGDNTYSNYAEANRAFYRQTVIPYAQWLARALNGWFGAQLEDDMRLVVDLDSIPALEAERAELWSKLQATQFLSLNEKREALGYGRIKLASEPGDEVYIGAGQLPINGPDDGAIAGGPAEDNEPDARQGKVLPMRRGRLN